MSAPSIAFDGLRDCAPLSCSMAHPPTADVEMVPAPRTYTDEEFTRLEARLLAAHGQATEDGALGTVLDAAATDVLFRLTGQHGLQFRGCQREVLEHIIYGTRSTFYLARASRWCSGCSLRGHSASS